MRPFRATGASEARKNAGLGLAEKAAEGARAASTGAKPRSSGAERQSVNALEPKPMNPGAKKPQRQPKLRAAKAASSGALNPPMLWLRFHSPQ